MIKKRMLIVGLVLMIGLASASFDVDDSSSVIEKNYYEGDFVRGVLNMSFSEQDNEDFTSNFKGGIDIVELLRGMSYNSSRDFICDPVNCESDYYVNSGTGSEIHGLNIGVKKVYGFQIKGGEITGIVNNGLKFNVNVTSPPICGDNQVFVDLFDDGTLDFYNTQSVSGGACIYEEKDFGCFDEDEVTGTVSIEGEPYCEKIKLRPAPGYRIGAVISGSSSGQLRFSIYSTDWDSALVYGTATNPLAAPWVEPWVDVDYSFTEDTEVFVCVDAPSGSEGKYSIRINEDSDEMCGVNVGEGTSDTEFEVDYEIFALPRPYGWLKEFEFNADSYAKLTKRKLIDDLEDYLETKYDNDCSGDDGCIIPFSILVRNSTTSPILHSPTLKYKKKSAGSPTIYQLFELSKRLPKVSSDYLLLDVEKMEFRVPDSDGGYNFKLKLDGRNVIEEEVDVDIGFVFNVAPRFAFIGRSTSFIASGSTGVNGSTWDFGDGSSVVYSNSNSAQHLYSEAGSYVIKTTLKKSSGATSTRRFRVIVGDAKTSANLTLTDYKSRILNIQSGINSLPEWARPSVETALNFNTMKAAVASKKNSFELLGTNAAESAYVEIVNSLMNLWVPYSVFVSASGELPALVGFNNLNVEHIKSISGEGAGVDSSEMRQSIADWMERNYELSVAFETISADGDLQTTELLKKYKIKITQKPNAEEDYSYLVINHPRSGIVAKSSASGLEETVSGDGAYVGIDYSSPLQEIEFLIVGADAPDVEALGAYVSPIVSALGVSELPIRPNWWEDEGGNFSWGKFLIGMLILLIVTLAAYILLQMWYKKHYENHLFKDPTHLYNLINFIYNSRRAGLKDSVIKSQLKERKWKGEQIDYAFKKIDGKRTGMWEIPLFKFVENRKVREEIEKKQGMPIDARFIKR
ncbi:MAG: PKD domain-containing protein [Nanoarchaeota archaeon]|nr:PKD domain-containing protein [Nanoarchaeota archaeon]MBU1103819.1 PKD domain-containing protein [Nanoarchaeota archaeon]